MRKDLIVGALSSLAFGLYTIRRQQKEKQLRKKLLTGLGDPTQYKGFPIVVVVDIGSSSIRTIAYTAVNLCHLQNKSSCTYRQNEWVLINGSISQKQLQSIDFNGNADLEVIVKTVEEMMDQTLYKLGLMDLTSSIIGVGFTSFVMNILGVDENSTPVTPVYTYAGRRPSTARYARQLKETLVKRGVLGEFHNRTGTTIHPCYAPAEFLRLHHEEREIVDRVVKWQSISGYLISRWTGTKYLSMSLSEASWTGLLDFRNACWDVQLLDLVHMDVKKMPQIEESSKPFMGLRKQFAKRWPELRHVPFYLGIADGAAANIGSKCLNDSRVCVTVGTSAALRVVVPISKMDHARIPSGLWCYRFGKDKLLLGGALIDGGSMYQWVKDSFRASDKELQKLEGMLPNQHGLTILPFLSGERAPGWIEEATCSIVGITKWTTPVDIMRAAIESVSLRLSLVFSLLAGYAQNDAMVVASGTALTSSPLWRQILADCMGRKLIMEESAVESSARGVAIFVGVALGLHTFEDMGEFQATMLSSIPQVTAHAAYLEARHKQESLYRKLYLES